MTKNRYGGLDPQVVQNIRATARRLARTNAVPGMEVEDYEQDLVMDLWRRQEAYDPSRASFRTFAARIVARRVATLTAFTEQLAAARAMASIEERIGPDPNDPRLADLLPDPDSLNEDSLALNLDVQNFVLGLSPALLRCCAMLLEENRLLAASEAGLHRATFYENARRLRERASAAGLDFYRDPPRQIRKHAGMCRKCRCDSGCTGCGVRSR